MRLPVPTPVGRARPRRGRVPHRRHQGRRPGARRRDASPPPRTPRRRSRGTATRSRWCSAASIRSTATSTPSCARRSRSSGSTTRRSPTSRRRRARSASGSAAGSSACCTWRSCASASSASTTCRSSPPRRTSSTSVELVDGTRRDRRQPVGDAARRTRSRAIEEPYVNVTVLTPTEYIGAIMELCQQRRGEHDSAWSTCRRSASSSCTTMPLAEIVMDFFDQLKSRTRGYASLDYEPAGYRVVEPVEGRRAAQQRRRSTRSPRSCTATRRTTTAGA